MSTQKRKKPMKDKKEIILGPKIHRAVRRVPKTPTVRS